MKLHRILALLERNYLLTLSSMDRWFDIFYWPILDLIIWGFVSSYIQGISQFNILSVILGGIILWVFVWRPAQDISVYLLEDFWSKHLYHLFSSPVRISEHLAALLLTGAIKAGLAFLFLSFLAAVLFSFSVFGFPLFILAISIFLLILFGWAIGLVIAALIVRFGHRVQALAWGLVWIIQPFSCVFYPLTALPEWARSIAMLVPTTYVFENMRAVLNHTQINYLGFLYAFIGDVIALALATLFFYWAFEYARKNGLLGKGF